ncbi:MAG: hypothetical protein B6D36_17870 [Planctomycetes bacterium UTPLA1]|jgi:hypothetical protein|nr:MAG: hypothetical protein B6D36_17870 [Planctomycetes bacterium UTPLA1]
MIMLVLTRAFVECTSAVAAPAHNPGGRRGDIALVLAAIGVFCIIATCANIAFQQMPLFRNGFGRRMLAICVAGLSTIALFFNPSTQKSFEQQPLRHHPNPVIEFILVPYAALALTLILLPLVFLLHSRKMGLCVAAQNFSLISPALRNNTDTVLCFGSYGRDAEEVGRHLSLTKEQAAMLPVIRPGEVIAIARSTWPLAVHGFVPEVP